MFNNLIGVLQILLLSLNPGSYTYAQYEVFDLNESALYDSATTEPFYVEGLPVRFIESDEFKALGCLSGTNHMATAPGRNLCPHQLNPVYPPAFSVDQCQRPFGCNTPCLPLGLLLGIWSKPSQFAWADRLKIHYGFCKKHSQPSRQVHSRN